MRVPTFSLVRAGEAGCGQGAEALAEGIMSISLRNTPALLTRTHLGPYTSLHNQHNALGGREVARREPNGAVWKSLLPGHLLKVERLSPFCPSTVPPPNGLYPDFVTKDRGQPPVSLRKGARL